MNNLSGFDIFTLVTYMADDHAAYAVASRRAYFVT